MRSGPLRRVVVTGIGAVAPGAIGREAFWDSLSTEPPAASVRWIGDFESETWLDYRSAKRLDRVSQLAVAAALEALVDAGMLAEPAAPASLSEAARFRDDIDPERVAIWLGTGIGGVGTLESQMAVLAERGERLVSPFTVPMTMPNAPAAALSMRYGARGPALTTTTACASATDAIVSAARLVAEGRADIAISGGADNSLTPTCIAGFRNMRALSATGVSRPFDADRDGLAASESAGIVVLESLESARARGAHIYMEVLGGASGSDAFHITSPPPDGAGALRCMTAALDDAGIRASDVAHVNAHGTSTPAGDLAEATAIAALFEHRPPVTSIKGVTGHSFGAAGGIEAVAVALTIARRTLPPTVGTREVDDAMDIDVVTDARDWTPGPVISNSFGFGGHNSTAVFAPVAV